MADNPQAFPSEEKRNTSSDPLATPRTIKHPGMTLLDYFAGQALASLAREQGFSHELQGSPEVAKRCYRLAAAMLNERQSHEG